MNVRIKGFCATTWGWILHFRVLRGMLVLLNIGLEYAKQPKVFLPLLLLAIMTLLCQIPACVKKADRADNVTALCWELPEHVAENVVGFYGTNSSPIMVGWVGNIEWRPLLSNQTHASGNSGVAINYRWALQRMFNYDMVDSSLASESNVRSALALILFIVTWLIGGGVLVSAFVDTTRILFQEGQWRRWSCLNRNHAVLLGWDSNGPTIIREILDKHRADRVLSRIIIVSDQPTDNVRSELRCSGVGRLRWPWLSSASFSVYHGEYDSTRELKGLNLEYAIGVYVLGERDEIGRDSRVMLAPERIKSVINKQWRRSIYCEVFYSSFGLYTQLVRNYAPQEEGVCVVARNIHVSWAKRLFSALPTSGDEDGNLGGGVHFYKTDDESKDVRIVVVGFSDMGQAFSIEAASVAHYNSNRKQVYISIYDNSLLERKKGFEEVFPRIDEMADIHWDFRSDIHVGSEAFYNEIKGFAKIDDLTVVVACDTPEESMKYALPLAWNKPLGCADILLAQEVRGAGLNRGEESLRVSAINNNLHVFGMFGGEGFNLWERDKVAESLFVLKSRSRDRGEALWLQVSDSEKDIWRGYIDSLEEWCASEGLRVGLGNKNCCISKHEDSPRYENSFGCAQKKRIAANRFLNESKTGSVKTISLSDICDALAQNNYYLEKSQKSGKGI